MTLELEKIASIQNWSEVYELADTYRKQEQWQTATIAFRRVIELKPDCFWSYHHLGDTLSKLGQWHKATKAYTRAVGLDSSFFWSWHNLGTALGKAEQWQKATEAYNRAVEIDSSFFWSWYNLADVLSKLGQWDKAIANYLHAIQLDPQHQLVYQKLGTAFKQRDSLDRSIEHYRYLIKSCGHNSIFNAFKTKRQELVHLANILATEHQTIGAIIIYYMVLEIQPNQTEVLQQLKNLLLRQNQLEQTIAAGQSQLESELVTRYTTLSIPQPQAKLISGKVIFQANCLILPNQLEDLCGAVGWSRRPLDKVEQAIANSFCYVCAWHLVDNRRQLIGFARAVSDGVFQATLLDIVTHPNFQGQGIGKKIVQSLIKLLHQNKIKDITLFASPHIVDFYHKLGFVAQPDNLQWMVWNPKLARERSKRQLRANNYEQ